MSKDEIPTVKDLARLLKLRKVGPAEEPDAEQVEKMYGAEDKAGRGGAPPDVEQIRGLSQRMNLPGAEIFSQQPKWLRGLAEKKAAPSELLASLQKRVSRAPTRANLFLAQAILNDIGRKPGGSGHVRKFVTQELVDQLIDQGN